MQTKTQKLQKMPQNQMGPFVLKPHTFAKIKNRPYWSVFCFFQDTAEGLEGEC